jgi:hypothetical protein
VTLLQGRQRPITLTVVGFVAIIGVLTGCSGQRANAPALTATTGTATVTASISTTASSVATVGRSAAAPTASVPAANTATPTVAPAPIATATSEVASSTATAPPPSQPSATVAALAASANGSPAPATGTVSAACAAPPIRGFGLVWQAHAEVPALVGCPTGAEATVGVVSEQFEHGWMLELSTGAGNQTGGRTVYVLFGDNATVAPVPDTWVAGKDPATTGLTPPAGLVEPQRDFGKVWREGTNLRIRDRLGWALSGERGAAGAWQPYQHGQMIWTPDPKQIFVLGGQGQAADALNSWRLYPDLFVG